jgi:hypothetical protein
MGRRPRGPLVCGAWLRRRRTQLAVADRRDRSHRSCWDARGVLRDQGSGDRSLWPAGVGSWVGQTASAPSAGGRMARHPRHAWSRSLRRRRCHRGAHRGVRGGVLASFPARFVPVPPQIGRIAGNGNVVSGAGGDSLVASWAHVRLGRLIGLHAAHLDRSETAIPQAHGQPNNAQASRATTAAIAATTKT